jgi:hypothetical protein
MERGKIMTAEEALSQSQDGVIRIRTRGGLVAVSRAAQGFQASFIPLADGAWNLAGTLTLGTFSSVQEAEAAAKQEYDVNPDTWEPAPENIIGFERAQSTAPEVEGHHIRQHGIYPPPRESRAKLITAGVVAGVIAGCGAGMLLRRGGTRAFRPRRSE